MDLTCNSDKSAKDLPSFNAEQELARTHLNGPALILAGPGSGKTRVITGRLAYLIGESAVSPSSILTITFTKAAAEEMKKRSMSLMGTSAASVNFGTFHSIFLTILRHTYRFSSDNIISSRIQYEISREIIESEKIEIRDSDRFYSDLINEISRYKTYRGKKDEFNSVVLDNESFNKFYNRYIRRMNSLRLIDFDDMIIRCNSLFHEREEVRLKWSKKFSYIMIDEFQDIDNLQYETIKMLLTEEKNLFVVGDDDQSIYGFRGAEPAIMNRFMTDFPDTSFIKLSRNYRSAPEIVNTAAVIISDNKERLEKNIIASKSSVNPQAVDLREFENRSEELDMLKNELLKKNGDFSGAAIILRTNGLSSFFASELMLRDIPVICKEKLANIYEHFIAKDIFTYLAISQGSKSRADIYRIMNRPYRFISRNSVPTSEFDFDFMKKFHREDIRTFAAIRKLENDLNIMKSMRPYVAVHYLFHGVAYLEYLKNYASDKNIDYEALKSKALEIMEKARDYKSFHEWKSSVEDYNLKLQQMQKELNETDSVNSAGKNAVRIMTMHASKGLEFDEVFLPDVNEKIIPYRKAVLPKDIEEERRLFYVAVTRAKDKIHIWHIKDDYGKAMAPSEFIKKL